MMWNPSKETAELLKKANEAYEAGDLEEYKRLHAELTELFSKEIEEHEKNMPSSFC